MRVTYPQWVNFDGKGNRQSSGIINGGVRQGKGKGKNNWNHYSHYNYNNGYPSYHNQMMRMTMSTGSTMSSRVHRKIVRIPSKRHPGKALPGKLHSMARIPGKVLPGKRLRPNQTAHCDNSNDSGLGVEQYADTPYANSIRQLPSTRWRQATSSTTTSESAAICPNSIDEASSSSSSASQSMYEMTNQSMPSISSQTLIQTNANNANIQMHDDKRQKLQQQLVDSEDTCSNDAFMYKLNQNEQQFNSNQNIPAVKMTPISRSIARPAIRRSNLGSQVVNTPNNNIGVSGPVTLQSQIGAISQNGKYQLQILAQPEQQHRARYQTEGSRGAVKDRSGNSFPIVKLLGYDKAVTLQIFIGTDVGRVSPHMFYQACKVSGKNSTPCNEKKVEGTILIETDLKPENDMTATCDCVGILKERNVDVEHRFPEQTTGSRSKKKSTRCRMVFRTQITHNDGTLETLQVCSQQIICTQPPGVPEICKKSLISSPATGGLELFIIGKNFLKDTRVIFQARRAVASPDSYDTFWEESVMPDKEFLQQTHLICTVPSYIDVDIVEPVTVQMLVTSSNKYSEPHNFVYTPKSAFGPTTGLTMTPTLATLQHIHSSQDLGFGKEETRSTSPTSTSSVMKRTSEACPTLMLWAKHLKDSNKHDAVSLMPPPATTLPMNIRRSSFSSGLLGSCSSTDHISPPLLKSEIIDENSQNSMHSSGADSMNHDSMDTFNNDNNSMDANSQGAIMTQSPLEMIMQGPVMNQNGLMNMSSTSPINVVDLRVKQEEELSAQMQELVNPVMNENSNSSFMTPFTAKVNDLTIQVNEVPMYNAQSNLLATRPEAMLRNSLNAMNCKTDTQMQTAIEQQTNVFNAPTLMTEAGTASGLNHMLSFPTTTQAISPNILATSPTNQSPLSADVMLNSQPINPLNTSPTLMTVNGAATNNLATGINNGIQTESDIIMNPTISPTMMCSNASNESASLIPNNVAMSDAPMLTAPSVQPASETLLNNLIQPMTIEQSNAAVKNMILNAAAEILSSEPNSITHETTSNALMSLNAETSVSQTSQHSSSPTITNILTHTDSTSSVVVLAGNNKVIQNVVEAAIVQNAHEIIQNHVVTADSIQMGTFAQNSQVVNVQPVTTASAAATNLSPAQQSLLNNIQQEIHAASIETIKGDEITSTLENMVQKQRKLSEPMETNNSVVVQTTQQVNTPNVVSNARLPQDITAMSDHDLISYINPSCFDQV